MLSRTNALKSHFDNSTALGFIQAVKHPWLLIYFLNTTSLAESYFFVRRARTTFEILLRKQLKGYNWNLFHKNE